MPVNYLIDVMSDRGSHRTTNALSHGLTSRSGRLGRSCLPLFLLLLLVGTLRVESALAASLTIKFVDPNGKILQKVQVKVTNLLTKHFEDDTSDRRGQVEIGGLTAGRYELVAQLKNFYPVKEEIQLDGDLVLEKILFSEKYVNQANKEVAQAVEAGEYARAVELLEELLQLFPNNATLHANMAIAQGGLLEEDRALAAIDKAIQLDPDPKYPETKKQIQRDLFRDLGQKALNDHDFLKAVSYFRKLSELEPQNAEPFYGLALALGHSQKYEEALVAIDEAIKRAPQQEQYQKVKEMLEFNAGMAGSKN